MAFIYLDESGQFTKHDGHEYFVIGSFTVGDPRRTEKRFKSWQRAKFPRKLRLQPEIKFSEIKISDELRIKTLKYISNLDIRIRYSFLKRENIPADYKYHNKLKSGHLYTHIVGETLEMYLPTTDNEFRVFCDQRHLKGITRSEYKEILRTHLLPVLPKNTIIQIEMLDSTTDPNIQIADWVAGALAHYLENKKHGGEYYAVLKNNIIGEGRELFKDHWISGQSEKNKKSIK